MKTTPGYRYRSAEIPDSLDTLLTEAAARAGVSVSAWITDAIAKRLRVSVPRRVRGRPIQKNSTTPNT